MHVIHGGTIKVDNNVLGLVSYSVDFGVLFTYLYLSLYIFIYINIIFIYALFIFD